MSKFPITCLLIEDFGPDYHGAHGISETFMGQTISEVAERIVNGELPEMVLEISPYSKPKDITDDVIKIAGKMYLRECERGMNFEERIDRFFARQGFECPAEPDEFGDAVDAARDAVERAKEGV